MARAPRVVGVPQAVYDKQKSDKAERCQEYAVIGNMGIRDAITRETKRLGETVMLDPTETRIDDLIAVGFIGPVTAAAEEA